MTLDNFEGAEFKSGKKIVYFQWEKTSKVQLKSLKSSIQPLGCTLPGVTGDAQPHQKPNFLCDINR